MTAELAAEALFSFCLSPCWWSLPFFGVFILYLPIRRNQRCFCWHTRKCYMTNQVIYMYIYAIIYKLNYVCYMIDGLNHWNYGSGHDMYSEKRAPCFPRGHFARWCLHGLSKRPWLTAPKDEFCRYNMLPSEAAEICFILLAIVVRCNTVLRNCFWPSYSYMLPNLCFVPHIYLQ